MTLRSRTILVCLVLMACGDFSHGMEKRANQSKPSSKTCGGGNGAASPCARLEWWVEDRKAGTVELGKPMPHALLRQNLEKYYVADYIADAQPVDAFKFEDPPLTVEIENGPFTLASKRGESMGTPRSERYRDNAVKVARDGALVRTIRVTGAGLTTKQGIGVGSTLSDLKKAYPDFKNSPAPETLGNDTCFGHTKSLPSVSFIFETCAKADQGQPVLRIDLWDGW